MTFSTAQEICKAIQHNDWRYCQGVIDGNEWQRTLTRLEAQLKVRLAVHPEEREALRDVAALRY